MSASNSIHVHVLSILHQFFIAANTYVAQQQQSDQDHSPSTAAVALDVQHLVDQSK